jgi:hypothetical protein
MASGVFSLRKVYKKQCEDVLNGNFFSWPEGQTYGYFGGGSNSGTGQYSLTTRIDFSTEVLSNPSKFLSQSRQGTNATSNSFYGYFGGGFIFPATVVSTVDRLDFSTEIVSTPSTKLSQSRTGTGAVSSTFYGYYAGGTTATPTLFSTIDRLDFSSEIISATGRFLPQQKSTLPTVSSTFYGYFVGGFFPPPAALTTGSTIDRLDFSTETITTPANRISSNRASMGTVLNSSYGYFGGGYTTTPSNFSTIERLDFSTETTALPGKFISTARRGVGSVSSISYGYFGGGYTPYVCTIDRLDFSTETGSVTSNGMPAVIAIMGGVSGGQSIRRPTTTIGNKTYGYFGGGGVLTPDLTTLIDRLDFSTETVTVPSPKLPQRRINMGVSSSGICGYFGGGYVFAPVSDYVSEITRLDFSSDTVSVPTPKLTTKKSRLNASSSSTYGYFGGGYVGPTPSPVLLYSTIERLDFLNETISTPTTYLSRQKRNLTGTSSEQYGYYGGGNIIPMPPVANKISDIDRLDFSTETTTRNAFLPTAKDVMGATSSQNYAYYVGGSLPTYVNVINRLDFSTESVTISPAVLTASRGNIAATSSSSYGYFGGGYFTPVASVSSIIDRLDFSSETVQTSTPLRLTLSRWGASAVSNSN